MDKIDEKNSPVGADRGVVLQLLTGERPCKVAMELILI